MGRHRATHKFFIERDNKTIEIEYWFIKSNNPVEPDFFVILNNQDDQKPEGTKSDWIEAVKFYQHKNPKREVSLHYEYKENKKDVSCNYYVCIVEAKIPVNRCSHCGYPI